MNLFFDFPNLLQISILTEWLRWKDIGRLDSAICSKLRLEFRNLNRSEKYIFATNSSASQLKPSIAWLLNHGMKLRSVEFQNVKEEDIIAFLQHAGSGLETVIFKCVVDFNLTRLLDQTCEHCPRVTNLTLEGFFVSHSTHLPLTLESLTLHSRYNCYLSHGAVPTLTSLTVLNPLNFPVEQPGASDINLLLRSLSCTDVKVCAHFPNVVTLVLQFITVSDLHTVTQHCKKLRDLDLYNSNGTLAIETAQQIVKHLPEIECFRITSHNLRYSVTTDALHLLITQCVSLQKLALKYGCNKVIDVSYPTDYTGSRLLQISIDCGDAATLHLITTHCLFLQTLYMQKAYTRSIMPEEGTVPVEQALHYITNGYTYMNNVDILQLQHSQLESLTIVLAK